MFLGDSKKIGIHNIYFYIKGLEILPFTRFYLSKNETIINLNNYKYVKAFKLHLTLLFFL